MKKIIRRIFKKYRFYKANKKWEKDFEWIKQRAKLTNREFYWLQLIHQEIAMWIKIGEEIRTKEFVCLCDRRGFDDVERIYLREMMEYIGLLK